MRDVECFAPGLGAVSSRRVISRRSATKVVDFSGTCHD